MCLQLILLGFPCNQSYSNHGGRGGGIWSKEGDMEYIGGKYGVQRRGYKVHMGGGIRVNEYGVQRKRR